METWFSREGHDSAPDGRVSPSLGVGRLAVIIRVHTHNHVTSTLPASVRLELKLILIFRGHQFPADNHSEIQL